MESGGQPWASTFDVAQPLQAFATVGAWPCPPCDSEAVLPLLGSSSLLSQGNGGSPLQPPGFNYCVLQ